MSYIWHVIICISCIFIAYMACSYICINCIFIAQKAARDGDFTDIADQEGILI